MTTNALPLFLLVLVVIKGSLAWASDSDIMLVGANPLGSQDKSVPAWTGGIEKQVRAGSHHENPFKHESPLFIIDARNFTEYRDRLSEGLIALLEAYPDTFNIPVYQSHRTASYPDWFYDNMKTSTSGSTHLSEDGSAIENPIAGINFPEPKSGLEAVWNHLTRWRGRYLKRNMIEGIVYDNGSKKLFKSLQEVTFELYRGEAEGTEDKPVLLRYFSSITEPPNLAGGALLAIDYLNQRKHPRQTWSYDAGQRRVKRMPFITYDNPAIMAESLRTADDTDIFSGAPDRFDWHLDGKQIMYIPYNSYDLSSSEVTYDELLTPNHLNPRYTRFEAHRVWKLVATLKPGLHHVYTKRVFYIDEDTWSIVLADQYDQKGQIWRVSMAHLKNYYDVPVTMAVVDVFHDLKSGYYHISGLTNEEVSSGELNLDMPPPSYFTPSGMRSRMRR